MTTTKIGFYLVVTAILLTFTLTIISFNVLIAYIMNMAIWGCIILALVCFYFSVSDMYDKWKSQKKYNKKGS